MMPAIEAVLFDLDGTLVDSERESAEAMARVLARAGIHVAQAHRDFVVGHSWNEIYALLARDFAGLPLAQQELIARSAAERFHLSAGRGMTIMPCAAPPARRPRTR